METLEFKLGAFEGPLELLLHLISRHKMKITDIEIGKLLEQYLAYMEEMQDADLEVSSAFLEMAARLVYIKTVSLVAGFLAERYNGGTSLFVRTPSPVRSDPVFRGNMPPEKLLSAYILAAGKAGRRLPPSADAFNGIVHKRFVSVSSRIVWLLRRLYKTGWANYNDLFVSGDRSELVATFLAVLELMKSGRITMNEDNTRLTFNRRSTSSDDGKES